MATKRSGAGLNSSQELSQLVTSVNTSLTLMGTSNKPIHPRIAFVDDGSGSESGEPQGKVISEFKNGDGSPGEIVRYAFSPVANAPETWLFGKDRDEVNETVLYLEIKRERHAPPATKLYWDTQDVYGILDNKIPAILDRAGMLYDWLLARALNDNPTCYDGLPFFSTVHWIDPNDHSKGVFSNDISVAAADADGLSAGLDALNKIPWYDGKARGAGAVKPIMLVPSLGLALKFGNLVNGALIPTATSTQHVAASSPFEGLVSDIITFNALLSEGAKTDAPKYVYLVNPGSAQHAGLIVSPRRDPTFFIAGLDPSEECRVKQGCVLYGWDDFSGCGVGLPQDVVRIKVG